MYTYGIIGKPIKFCAKLNHCTKTPLLFAAHQVKKKLRKGQKTQILACHIFHEKCPSSSPCLNEKFLSREYFY